ncbi:serine/threonine protein kinase [Nonomuraea thailandensis]|uniref:non-specific serine/threonine protein kinase n=1 Tax=Nonomuraea thailandensis TaxID=1188745 RepID=A0A9X2GAF3_9ACTN|nr:serine/threonine-protein kinase [Nonomuraea thailandensis]MCP2355341.1 serine/threonine protein kinase [Nonomuraea thailandensis]
MPGEGDVLRGRYALLRRLGKGGMGTVWAGRDEELGREVAVKLLDAGGGDQEWPARFRREARVMAMLRHPNIVVVHDVGEHDGTPFLVMELLPGPDLGEIVRQQQPLPVSWVVEYGAQIAAALARLHQEAAPVVHRDVKPQNLVLDLGGVLKLCDFGIARLPTLDLTRYTGTGARLGTVVYMSPEQCNAFEVGPPTDVYSFGVVLYELLTGGLPFSVENGLQAYAMQVVGRTPPPVGERRPGVWPELAELVHATLAKRPESRPDAGQVHAALTAMAGAAKTGANVEAEVQAELDRIRVKLQTGRGAEAGMRLVRLIVRARTGLGPEHEVTRQVVTFAEIVRGGPAT